MKNYLKIATTLLCITLTFPLPLAFSQSLPLNDKLVRELTLKASLLFKLTQKIKWPKDVSTNENNLILCFQESDYFRGIINLAVKHPRIAMDWEVRENVSLEATKNCNVLFLDFGQEKRLEETIAYVKDYPVLTVGDTEGFAERGVLINFIVVDNKLRFKIQKDAIQTSSLQINEELLSLAIR
jgi:hypothetical protein